MQERGHRVTAKTRLQAGEKGLLTVLIYRSAYGLGLLTLRRKCSIHNGPVGCSRSPPPRLESHQETSRQPQARLTRYVRRTCDVVITRLAWRHGMTQTGPTSR